MIGKIYISKDGIQDYEGDGDRAMEKSDQIGTFPNLAGELVRGVELLDVIAQYKKYSDCETINVEIKTPGGLVEEGDKIYDYLNSLKEKHTVNTISTGDIGSIGTKIFLVGEKRIMGKGHEFFIHNPWTNPRPGDSNWFKNVAEDLKTEEDKLMKFYLSATDITEEGIKPLMDKETALTAEQAVTLGFATSTYEPIKVLAILKNKNNKSEKMSKEDKSLLDKVKALIMGSDQEVKSLLVDLEGGSQVYVVTEDAGDLLEKEVFTVEEGEATETAASDGDHVLADGRTITVSEGKISEVKEAEPEAKKKDEEETFLELATQIAASNERSEANAKAIESIANSLQEFIKSQGETVVSKDEVAEAIDKKIEDSIAALKKDIPVGKNIKVVAKQPGQKEKTEEYKPNSIQAHLLKKQEEMNKKKIKN